MDFGYFTLSDNHYLNNTRTPNKFVATFQKLVSVARSPFPNRQACHC